MKKNLILVAIILLLNISAISQLRFIETLPGEKDTKANSTELNDPGESSKYIILNQMGVQKGLVENDYQSAIGFFKEAMAENPECFICQYNMARSYLNLGRLDEATVVFNELVKAKPKFADSYAGLGEILNEKKRFEESALMYQKAVELNPTDALIFNNYATILDKLGENKQALNFFDKAIEINPEFAKAYASRGVTLFKLERYDDALKSLEKAVKISQSDASIHNNLGVVLDKLGKTDEALEHYQKAIRLKPDFHEAMYNLGLFYFEEGKDAEAQMQVKILEKENFELARRLRKIVWSRYILDASEPNEKN